MRLRKPTGRQVLWTVVAVSLVVMAGGLVTATFIGAINSSLIRQTQTTNTSTLNSSNRVLELIEDCTTPGGECYERGNQRTASAVGDIGRVTVLAAACAASVENQALTVPARADLIQTCILANLNRDR